LNSPVAESPRVLGIDVSHYQGNIPWDAVAASGVRFAIIKASEGLIGVDPMFEKNLAGAKAAGLLTGAYHFVNPARPGEASAVHFWNVVKGRTDLPPFMDFEHSRGVGADDTVHQASRFAQKTDELWGRPCAVYTYPSYWKGIWDGKLHHVQRWRMSELAKRDLWIAHYTKSPNGPTVPNPFENGWKIWQWDGDGGQRLPNGADCDFNWFNGSYESLVQWCHDTGLAPDTQPSTPTSKSSQSMKAVTAPIFDGPANPLGWADRAEREAEEQDKR
jgi:lysozyme